ncbi:MAG: hypothetical protein HYW23_01905 [Candidatus Aenigmarchaeota archaeon]|nr:hypothetical protein [Candidatus Aenigmarchaeota archaeon]
MDSEKVLTLIYLVLGAVAGFVSNKFDYLISLGIGIIIYLVSFIIVRKIVKAQKKTSWYVLNSLVTFLLVWLVAWIMLRNL